MIDLAIGIISFIIVAIAAVALFFLISLALIWISHWWSELTK